jgi:hypothetical protein
VYSIGLDCAEYNVNQGREEHVYLPRMDVCLDSVVLVTHKTHINFVNLHDKYKRCKVILANKQNK